ncbi:hypothetical protein EV191_105172 [Tamaricihabitans halophyticus]|uniref:DUF4064 domain-containing protein n=2 Tax=Tamaricihabitans halophyticus TaxID=1262583 RepID=A0A4R2QVJ9_9PSEU|nr:hypothetical protein EV191_105172 [Tamaricihabitans halophyticus]
MPTADEAAAQGPGTAPPKLVNYSFWLWIGAAVFAVVGSGLAFTAKDGMIQDAVDRNNDPNITPEQIADGANTLLWSLFIGSVVLAVFYVLFAYKMRDGNRSARNWLLGFTIVTVLFQLLFGTIIGLFSGLLTVVAIALLYTASTRDYFPHNRR